MIEIYRRIGLSFSYNAITPGDGNCWYHSVVNQISRPDINPLINSQFHSLSHYDLRLRVVNYIRQNQENNLFIRQYRLIWFQNNNNNNNNNSCDWEGLLNRQTIIGTWATELFCVATAMLLNVTIRITAQNSNRQSPYYSLNPEATSGAILFILNSNDNHFQSLLPLSDVSNNDSDIDFEVHHVTQTKNSTKDSTSFEVDHVTQTKTKDSTSKRKNKDELKCKKKVVM